MWLLTKEISEEISDIAIIWLSLSMASFFIIVKLENRFLSLLNAPSRSVFVCFNFIASFSQFLFKVSTLAVMLFSFVNTTETEKNIKVSSRKMDTKIQCTLLFIRCKLLTIHCTLYTVKCILYIRHYTLYSIQLQHTLYKVHLQERTCTSEWNESVSLERVFHNGRLIFRNLGFPVVQDVLIKR